MEITKDTVIEEALAKYPSLVKVFIDFGLPCLVCGQPFWGTIENLVQHHNVNLNDLLDKVNKIIKEKNL